MATRYKLITNNWLEEGGPLGFYKGALESDPTCSGWFIWWCWVVYSTLGTTIALAFTCRRHSYGNGWRRDSKHTWNGGSTSTKFRSWMHNLYRAPATEAGSSHAWTTPEFASLLFRPHIESAGTSSSTLSASSALPWTQGDFTTAAACSSKGPPLPDTRTPTIEDNAESLYVPDPQPSSLPSTPIYDV